MFQISKFSVLVAAISLVAADTLYAQNYNITPNDSVVAVAPFNDFNHFTIQENNLTTNALIFSWQQVLLSVPAGWTANLCDAGHCYTGFPVTGTMDTVFNGDFGLMSIGVDPGTILGTAFIQYVVWEESTPLQKDTLTWIITANGSTGINDIGAKTTFSIFPNPSDNNIQISSNLQSGFQFLISDVSGKGVLTGSSKTNSNIVSVENVPSGVYHFLITDKNKISYTRQILIQR